MGCCCFCWTKLDDPAEFCTVLFKLKLMSTLLLAVDAVFRPRNPVGLNLVLGSEEDILDPVSGGLELGGKLVPATAPNLNVDLGGTDSAGLARTLPTVLTPQLASALERSSLVTEILSRSSSSITKSLLEGLRLSLILMPHLIEQNSVENKSEIKLFILLEIG